MSVKMTQQDRNEQLIRRLYHLAEPKVKKEFWNEHIQESTSRWRERDCFCCP
jgi:hypothetical protein